MMESVYVLADGLSGEGFLKLGCVFLVPALLIVIIEWLVLRYMCGRPKTAFTASFLGNLASAGAGIVLMLAFMAGWNWLPKELDRYYTAERIYFFIRYAGYFLLSFGVEYVVVRSVILPQGGAKRLGWGVLVGNLITYGLISPVLFWATIPRQDLTDLRSDSAWCADHSTTILFLNPTTGFLKKTDPQRAHTETVLAHHMTDYQIRPDLQSGLFLDGTKLCQFKGGTITDIETLEGSDRRGYSLIAQVAMSPSGRWVAYTTPIKTKNASGYEYEKGRQLMVFDTQTTQSYSISSPLENISDAPAIVWSEREDVIWARQYWESEILQLSLASGQARSEIIKGGSDLVAAKMYGTFDPFNRPMSRFDYEVAADETPQLGASLHNFLGQSLLLWTGTNHEGLAQLELGIRPGTLAPSKPWHLADVGIIRGSTLCIMEEDVAPMLYLIDVDAHRLGRLVPGRKMVLLNEKYEAGKYLRKE
jgi:hypothetical protein